MSHPPVRIAAAPISWGVSEVPGWGHQLAPEHVLAQMRDLGIEATEFGPDGFLPDDPEQKAATLAAFGLRAVGGFLPVVLHDPAVDPLPIVDRFIDALLASGAEVVVVAAASGADGYDARPDLDAGQWRTLLENLDRIAERAAERGVVAAIHPHVGTMVQTSDEVERVLTGSRIGLCVDTGHLMVGGADPVALVERHPERVTHVHLKDVDAKLAHEVLLGELPFGDAVAAGLFRPLGAGDVEIARMIRALRDHGYAGWYVLEQDIKLSGVPDGEGPLGDVRASRDYVLQVAS
ncbi:inosose dehydratase [Aeromicrobium camelliae]|uniref:Inosose dehydratase n=1 Tax=Aeromicrobium camelliae TaxID=1538144 RepID=A0A3N6ZMU2_9ACTN|nr:TIM barrel protein [Aeromicrobium camelliae]RQN08367.1 inosose dehydratase [Aeromicrobium camelliae]